MNECFATQQLINLISYLFVKLKRMKGICYCDSDTRKHVDVIVFFSFVVVFVVCFFFGKYMLIGLMWVFVGDVDGRLEGFCCKQIVVFFFNDVFIVVSSLYLSLCLVQRFSFCVYILGYTDFIFDEYLLYIAEKRLGSTILIIYDWMLTTLGPHIVHHRMWRTMVARTNFDHGFVLNRVSLEFRAVSLLLEYKREGED